MNIKDAKVHNKVRMLKLVLLPSSLYINISNINKNNSGNHSSHIIVVVIVVILLFYFAEGMYMFACTHMFLLLHAYEGQRNTLKIQFFPLAWNPGFETRF